MVLGETSIVIKVCQHVRRVRRISCTLLLPVMVAYVLKVYLRIRRQSFHMRNIPVQTDAISAKTASTSYLRKNSRDSYQDT